MISPKNKAKKERKKVVHKTDGTQIGNKRE